MKTIGRWLLQHKGTRKMRLNESIKTTTHRWWINWSVVWFILSTTTILVLKKCKAWIRCTSCQVTFGPRKGASGRRPFLVDLQQECCFLHLEQRHKMGRNSVSQRLAASDCPKTDQTSTSHLFLLSFSFLPLGTRTPIPPGVLPGGMPSCWRTCAADCQQCCTSPGPAPGSSPSALASHAAPWLWTNSSLALVVLRGLARWWIQESTGSTFKVLMVL